MAAQDSIAHTHTSTCQYEYADVRYSSGFPASTVTTIEFQHAPSTFRILIALTLALLGCITATLLWVFMGPDKTGLEADVGEQWGGCAGSGMWVGILVLLWKGVGFGMWVVFSYVWKQTRGGEEKAFPKRQEMYV